MLPTPHSPDVRHLLSAYAKHRSDVQIPAVCSSDLEDLNLSELCHSVPLSALWLFAKCVVGMPLVLTVCASFKVLNTIIGLDAIPVVGMWTIWILWQKRIRHQPMCKPIVNDAVLAESEDDVSVTWSTLKHLRPVIASIRNRALHSAKVANFVLRKFLDCFPDFGRTFARHWRPLSSRF